MLEKLCRQIYLNVIEKPHAVYLWLLNRLLTYGLFSFIFGFELEVTDRRRAGAKASAVVPLTPGRGEKERSP